MKQRPLPKTAATALQEAEKHVKAIHPSVTCVWFGNDEMFARRFLYEATWWNTFIFALGSKKRFMRQDSDGTYHIATDPRALPG